MFTLALPTWMRLRSNRHQRDIRVRAVMPSDAGALVDFLLSLSEQLCRLRYLSRRIFDATAAQAEAQQIIRRSQRGIVLAAYAQNDPSTLLGLVELVADRQHSQIGEIALAVRDTHQGQGIGTLLANRAASLAQQQGIQMLQASMFRENAAMHHMLARLGRAEPIGYDSGILDLQVALGPEDLRLRWVA